MTSGQIEEFFEGEYCGPYFVLVSRRDGPKLFVCIDTAGIKWFFFPHDITEVLIDPTQTAPSIQLVDVIEGGSKIYPTANQGSKRNIRKIALFALS